MAGVAATLTADVVFVSHPSFFPQFAAAAFLGIALGQVGVLAAWLALGQSFWLVRLTALLVGIVSLAHWLADHAIPTAPEFLGFLALFSIGVAAPLVGLRWWGLRVTSRREALSPARSALLPWRYSLGALFSITTVTAIVAAMARVISFPPHDRTVVALHGAALVATALGALATLGLRRRVGVGWLASLLAMPTMAAAVGLVQAIALPLASVAFLEAAYLCGVVGLLKLSGFRVVW